MDHTRDPWGWHFFQAGEKGQAFWFSKLHLLSFCDRKVKKVRLLGKYTPTCHFSVKSLSATWWYVLVRQRVIDEGHLISFSVLK